MQSQPLTPENILLREATYRAVGEVFPHVQAQVNFGSWYESELRHMLQSNQLTGARGTQAQCKSINDRVDGVAVGNMHAFLGC